MKKLSFKLFIALLTSLPLSDSLLAQSQQIQGSTVKITVKDNHQFSFEDLDPCQVFIGVATKSEKNGGVKVDRIIDDSPASKMDLRVGDIILALDGEEINNPCDLTMERDQNQAGDYFRLTILRTGKKRKVRGQFTPCVDNAPILTPAPEITNSSELKYQSFEAYPNPTFGEVNISFEGAAVPTTFMVTDVTGKVVLQEELKNFDGFYRNQIQLKNSAAPGTVSLTVIQNGQAVSKNIVLLNRY